MFCTIHLRVISQELLVNLIRNMCFGISLLKLLPRLQGANELIIKMTICVEWDDTRYIDTSVLHVHDTSTINTIHLVWSVIVVISAEQILLPLHDSNASDSWYLTSAIFIAKSACLNFETGCLLE